MKDLETTKQLPQTETAEASAGSLPFADVLVYHEMADQTAVKMNLIEQIHGQLNQLEELTQKRQFLLKEVLQYIVD